MFHYVNAITNTKGDALIGYFVKAVNPVTGDVASLFADENSTPIENVSGIADACEINADGNASFYIADGEYHIDIYATDGATFVRRIEDVPMAKTGLLQADTVSQLASADTGYPVILKEAGKEGIFLFIAEDKSIEVAADPESNNFVAPTSDVTGTTGAWVRQGAQPTPADDSRSGVVTGCGVAYTGDLSFVMSAGTFDLDGIRHSAVEQTITLTVADGTNPRLDVLYLDTDGVLQKLTGTAAASPSKPAVDPSSQLELTFILVPSGAVTLDAVTTEDIYQEGIEWTASQSASTLDLASTNNPYAGTKCIETTSTFAAGQYVNFARGSNEAFGGDGNLILRIRSKAAWHNKRLVTVQFWCDGAVRGKALALGNYGFVSSVIAGYQAIVIPKADFAISAGTEIDALRLTSAGSGNPAPTFYLDGVQLQSNGAAIGGDLTQSAADARYLKLSGGTLSGDLNVPDEAYNATNWNGSLEVPTKNAVRDALESISAGIPVGTLAAANNLSDVANAATSRTNLGLGTGDSPQFTAINVGNASDTTVSRASAGDLNVEGNIVYRAGGTDVPVTDGGTGSSTAAGARTNLGAKASTPAIQSVSSSATVTPTFSDDQVIITAQAAALALANPTGSALDGWGISIRIKDNGTARAISYGTQYRAIGVTLPTTTVLSKTLYLGMIFNNADTKWDVVAVAQEA